MILYKYLSYHGGLKIFESNAIGFRPFNALNDPFEVSAAYPSPSDPFEEVALEAKTGILRSNYSALCLTRSPNHPLMWSHYADQHKGWVIGLNVDQEIFTSHDKNTVPVQYGSIIYTATKPSNSYLVKGGAFNVGAQKTFDYKHLEKYQRRFLYKSAYWAHEEEVRVVKCCEGIEYADEYAEYCIGTIRKIDIEGDLYLVKLPPESIVEVVAGLRNRDCDDNGSWNKIRQQVPKATLYKCKISPQDWTIARDPI